MIITLKSPPYTIKTSASTTKKPCKLQSSPTNTNKLFENSENETNSWETGEAMDVVIFFVSVPPKWRAAGETSWPADEHLPASPQIKVFQVRVKNEKENTAHRWVDVVICRHCAPAHYPEASGKRTTKARCPAANRAYFSRAHVNIGF